MSAPRPVGERPQELRRYLPSGAREHLILSSPVPTALVLGLFPISCRAIAPHPPLAISQISLHP
jgi:hypothetical protein